MNKTLLFLLFLITSITLKAQNEKRPELFSTPELKKTILSHKTVAIIPFKISVNYINLPNGMTSEMVVNEELKMGFDLQSGMYTYLKNNSDKYTVQFQELDKTNIQLIDVGFEATNEVLKPKELCKTVNVDAIIIANYSFYKKVSDENEAKKNNPYASLKDELKGDEEEYVSNGGVAHDYRKIQKFTMQIYEAQQGKLLWEYKIETELNEDDLYNSNTLMENIMKMVSNNFPYERIKK